MKSKRAREYMNRAQMQYHKHITVAKESQVIHAVELAEQDARDRAIEAFTNFCRWHHTDMHDISNCPHNEECGNRCGYFIKFMDTYDK